MNAPWIQLLLWLYVLNLGVACGAGLYESRVLLPTWLVGSDASGYSWNRAAAVRDNVGLRFWVYVSTVPLTLLTLAGMLAVWYVPAPARHWWLGALAAGLLERAMTFGYFIPAMIRLMTEGALSDAQAATQAQQWARFGYVRHAANIVGLLAALKTFATFYAHLGP